MQSQCSDPKKNWIRVKKARAHTTVKRYDKSPCIFASFFSTFCFVFGCVSLGDGIWLFGFVCISIFVMTSIRNAYLSYGKRRVQMMQLHKVFCISFYFAYHSFAYWSFSGHSGGVETKRKIRFSWNRFRSVWCSFFDKSPWFWWHTHTNAASCVSLLYRNESIVKKPFKISTICVILLSQNWHQV